LKTLEEVKKEAQKLCQVMMKTLETDNIQSELFMIYANAKDKCKTFTELAKKYGQYKTKIKEMSQRRYKILEDIEVLMVEFSKEKGDGKTNPERVEFLKLIDEKCNTFNNCFSTIQRGGHFYIQLAAHIEQLTQTINDYVMSRKIEKEEILSHPSPQL
jgi:hypothetical protein